MRRWNKKKNIWEGGVDCLPARRALGYAPSVPLFGNGVDISIPFSSEEVPSVWVAQVVLGGEFVDTPAIAVFARRTRNLLLGDLETAWLLVNQVNVAM